MLYLLAKILGEYYGPFRLLTSHMFLITVGMSGCFFLTWYMLPKCFKFLPVDRGRDHSIESAESKGKPTSAGLVFISISVLVSLLVIPTGYKQVTILVLTMFTMIAGLLDDLHSWHEYKKGIIDLAIALVASLVLLSGSEPVIWLPFTKELFHPSPIVYIVIATLIIWTTINITNCSDGVDGLSATMVIFALIGIGSFLYLIAGHIVVSKYLLIPYSPQSPGWAIMIFTFAGGIAGYLWYNAFPAQCLMGDTGARTLGFIVGVAVIISGNPVLMLLVCSVMFANGGVGLVKVALLRFLGISIFKNIRFPLHDHFRQVKNWSSTQVLIRFALIQVLLTILLLGIMIKVR
ncbi:MAG: phospho-N-acetylmuramoyl-pentapeptide-transferase [Candidatus Scalindua sp.]